MMRVALFLACFVVPLSANAETPTAWWAADVQTRLPLAKGNRAEIEKALRQTPEAQRKGMAFLVQHMPESDLQTLKADYLLTNTELAYKARAEVPWGKDIPEELFLNDVLPYANVDEERDAWRKDFYDLCMPMVKGCKTPTEAAMKLNGQLFGKLKLGYSTQRRAPNQGPKESIQLGKASCTGLSIVLSDACRAICIPARLVGTPLWANKRGNHTWVEIWDREWHFTGACEQDPSGLNKGWFVGDAAQAKKESFEHAIYASSFKKTSIHFPLVWAMNNKSVPAENVTDRYAKPAPKMNLVRVMIRVRDDKNQRQAVPVVLTVADAKVEHKGTTKDEKADTNDFLTFELPRGKEIAIRVGREEKKLTTPATGELPVVDFVIK